MWEDAHFLFFFILFCQFEEEFLETREQYEKLLQGESMWNRKKSVTRLCLVSEKTCEEKTLKTVWDFLSTQQRGEWNRSVNSCRGWFFSHMWTDAVENSVSFQPGGFPWPLYLPACPTWSHKLTLCFSNLQKHTLKLNWMSWFSLRYWL